MLRKRVHLLIMSVLDCCWLGLIMFNKTFFSDHSVNLSRVCYIFSEFIDGFTKKTLSRSLSSHGSFNYKSQISRLFMPSWLRLDETEMPVLSSLVEEWNKIISNRNRTEWRPIRSVIVREITKSESDLFITSWTITSWTTRIRHLSVLPILKRSRSCFARFPFPIAVRERNEPSL